MNIACVLRESPDFKAHHVSWLRDQCERFIPHDRFICYSDVPVDAERVELANDWPSWWMKMQIHADRSLLGPVLILDLDTVVVNHFRPTAEHLSRSWVARHFFRDGFRAPEEFFCGVILTTEDFRRRVYERFVQDPSRYIGEGGGDDQKYFKSYFDTDVHRFQDEWPDLIRSYKLNVLQHGFTEDTAFIAFHGKPRPWDPGVMESLQ